MPRISFRKEVRLVKSEEGGRRGKIPALAAPSPRITQLSSADDVGAPRPSAGPSPQAQDAPIAPLQDRFRGCFGRPAHVADPNPRVMCRVTAGERDAVASIPRSGLVKLVCQDQSLGGRGGGVARPIPWPASPEQYREIRQQSIT